MICRIINPSDPYTLKTDDFVLGAVAVAILGGGKYGLDGPEGRSTPILFGWDEWLAEHVGDVGEYIAANKAKLADVLDSVMIGPAAHREDVEAMLREIPEERRAAWLAERQDRHRTSLNDIGTAAYALAARLRGGA